MLTEYQIFDTAAAHVLEQLIKMTGIILRLESYMNIYSASILLTQLGERIDISGQLLGSHTKAGVIVALEKIRRMVGKAECFHSESERRLDVFPLGALGMVTAEGMCVKICRNQFFTSRSCGTVYPCTAVIK